jgi:lipoprotein-releasing system permease protein
VAASFPFFVARRYLTARRRQAFISLISAVSILGVGVGVMALVIALALMTGVQTELRDRIVGASAHVYVYKHDGSAFVQAGEREKLLGPGVVGAAPAVLGPALIQAASRQVQFAMLKGIDPAREPDVTDIETSLVTGSLDDLVNRPPDAFEGVLLGSDLARALGVERGDLIDVLTPDMISTPVGMVPRKRPMQVVGTVRFGFYEIDNTQAFVALDSAMSLLGRSGPDMMQLRLEDMDEAPSVRARLQQELGPDHDVRDWTELNQELYAALWLEKIAISFTIGLIIMVAALNIIASLVLLVMEKTRDIAILRTMGAPARMIRRIFVYQGLTIGLVGTIGGAAVGLIVCDVAERYQLIQLPGDVYQITYLPFRVEPFDVAVVVISSVLVCLIATLYPSRQAGRIDPAEALRNQ